MESQLPEEVNIVEVGPRDGLQNEPQLVPANVKIKLIDKLSTTGLKVIECTSFVSAKWIPQLADAKAVMSGIKKEKNINYPALVPNMKGLEDAIATGTNTVSVFTATTDEFTSKNINSTVKESLSEIALICKAAKENDISVRGYISCAMGCPYKGEVPIDSTVEIAKHLIDLGCYEVSIGDTIGIGTALHASTLIQSLKKSIPTDKIAVHFHDTYGQALTNIYACMQHGISTIDSSIGGLGGCPYAIGASGNVATEDVLYMLNGLGIRSGVSLSKVLEVTSFVTNYLGHPVRSKVAAAELGKKAL